MRERFRFWINNEVVLKALFFKINGDELTFTRAVAKETLFGSIFERAMDPEKLVFWHPMVIQDPSCKSQSTSILRRFAWN